MVDKDNGEFLAVHEEVVKKVRNGKGEPEEIVSVILRLRDNEYSYQQYLIEKMEG